jgi:hypothetical protein
VVLRYAWRVTKYDPADRDEHGRYTGPETVYSDHGPVEQAYLDAVAAFAEDAGVARLAIRDPQVAGLVNFGVEPPVEGHGLAGLFPPDLAGYHDGAEVPLPVALALVRAMLRDHGAKCRLEAEGRFFVHVGYDQYVFVGSARPCRRAVARTRRLGLFAEPVDASPLDPTLDEPAQRRPADPAFWAELAALVDARGAVLLQELFVEHASRWYRLTPATDLGAVRAGLRPRARLLAWPDLSPDVDGVLASLPDDPFELVWEDAHGRLHGQQASDVHADELRELAAGARAATVVRGDLDQRHPLLTAVRPDADGVVRARWAP